MSALKDGFEPYQGFPYESSSHMVDMVLYVDSFYSLCYYYHYDHCLVNIAILHYR